MLYKYELTESEQPYEVYTSICIFKKEGMEAQRQEVPCIRSDA